MDGSAAEVLCDPGLWDSSLWVLDRKVFTEVLLYLPEKKGQSISSKERAQDSHLIATASAIL